jgi:hypothetical protein
MTRNPPKTHHCPAKGSSMTRDFRSDSQPADEPWLDRSMTAEELAALRTRLSKMTQADVVKFYDAGL